MGKPTSGGAGGSGGRRRSESSEYMEIPGLDFRDGNQILNEHEFMKPYREWAEPLYNEQAEAMGATAMDSVVEYEKDGYLYNDFLRKNAMPLSRDEERAKVDRVVAALDATMRPLANNLVVYRGAKIPGLTAAFRNGRLNGMVIEDNAYLSTTTNKSVASMFYQRNAIRGGKDATIFNIRLPKGTPVVYTNPNGDYGAQSEVIVQRGRSLRVVRSRIVDGVLMIDAEIT